jgi:hypothetical protein
MIASELKLLDLLSQSHDHLTFEPIAVLFQEVRTSVCQITNFSLTQLIPCLEEAQEVFVVILGAEVGRILDILMEC